MRPSLLEPGGLMEVCPLTVRSIPPTSLVSNTMSLWLTDGPPCVCVVCSWVHSTLSALFIRLHGGSLMRQGRPIV